MTAVMEMSAKELVDGLGPVFADRAARRDGSDAFVAENYAQMREAKLFSAMAPRELGGGGMRYSEMCWLVREMSHYCGSTALALSMHQHLVAAAVLNHGQGRPGEKLLRMVAGGGKVLVSTGGSDWLTSSGRLERCEGGYRFTARKSFASGCQAGDVLVTSGQLDGGEAGKQVLHFSVPMNAEGVRIERDWEAMGMRGTGSHSVMLEGVFIPEAAISVRRPYGRYHPLWNVTLTVALPLIVSVYVGLAEAAAEMARTSAAAKGDDGVRSILMGEVENELTVARMALESMVANADELRSEVNLEHASRALVRKTIAVEASVRTAEKALEVVGGRGYYRAAGLERVLRDIHAGQFHPLQTKHQQRFTGRVAMGLEPVEA